MVRPRTIVKVWLALLATGVGCVKSPTSPSGTLVTGYLSGVQTLSGAQLASNVSGAPPAASGGPAASLSTITSAINGGSNLVSLHSTSAFSQVIVSAANGSASAAAMGEGLSIPQAAAGTSASGFYRLALPSATTDQTIVVSFGQTIPFPEFDLQFQLVSPGGSVGALASVHMSVLEAGIGQVQVTASWDQLTDVDLHVVEPNQNEVFWFAATSPTGGVLDLDSNQACHLDGKNTENIRWTTNAPTGPYIVRLDYFDRCNLTTDTNYVVTVHNGGTTTVFTGSFHQNQADAGNVGAGRTITNFVHTASSFATGMFNAPGAPVASAGPPSQDKIRMSFKKD
jgi:hypothetical protein